MELPIQLKFFKKIELYQNYKYEEEKFLKSRFKSWEIEKKILKWTKVHFHLGSPLYEDRINREILNNQHSAEHRHAMGNLIERGYAKLFPGDHLNTDSVRPNSILITREGLLMGEVINEVEKGTIFLKFKYPLIFTLVWSTAIAGALIVIINFLKILYNLLGSSFLCLI